MSGASRATEALAWILGRAEGAISSSDESAEHPLRALEAIAARARQVLGEGEGGSKSSPARAPYTPPLPLRTRARKSRSP